MKQLVPNRKSIRLKGYNYSNEGWYYVTICAQNKICLFGEIVYDKMKLNKAGKVIEKYWEEISNHFKFVELDDFIVMPNHFHGITIINEQNLYRRGEVTSPLHNKPPVTLGNILNTEQQN